MPPPPPRASPPPPPRSERVELLKAAGVSAEEASLGLLGAPDLRASRLVEVLWYTFTFVGALGAALLVLYTTGDWGLLGLAIQQSAFLAHDASHRGVSKPPAGGGCTASSSSMISASDFIRPTLRGSSGS